MFFGKTLSFFLCVALVALAPSAGCAADPVPAAKTSTARFQSTYIYPYNADRGPANIYTLRIHAKF